MKLFELTTSTRLKFGRTLIQIRAVVDFKTVKAGDLGGWVEDEKSIGDNCWVYPDAEVFKRARLHGGEMHGGVMCGGEMHGGVMWGGVINKDNHIGFANVGSENGYLLAYIDDHKIMVSRGCFHGTIDEFYNAVDRTHGDNEHAEFYKSIRPIIEMKLSKFTEAGDEDGRP